MPGAQSFGRYRVTSTLGAGAMGEVFAAVDEVLGREVAVKTLKGHRNGLAARILDERFRQEARAIASLSHPGVVQVFDIDLTADPPYLVMERVAGPSLKERLEAGPLPIAELRALGIQIGRALAAAHAQKVIHRDVKPANILAAGPGTWKLADFGVAHVPDSSLTMTGQFIGSPAYAPPEALVRGQSDAEGDVYGLGATLYQAAAGTWPRLEDKSGALIPTVPSLATLAPQLPTEVIAIVDRAIAVEPTQRPTAAQIADALAVTGAQPVVAAPLVVTPPPVVAPAPPDSPISVRDRVSVAAVTLTPPAGFELVTGPVVRMAEESTQTSRPAEGQPWRRYALLGGVVLVLIAIVAASGSTKRTGTSASPTSAPAADLAASEPETLRFEAPPMNDARQLKDWDKVIDHLDKGNYREAKHKLEEWEEKHGATPQTEALRTFLEENEEREPKKRGKGKGKGRRDED